MKICILDGYSLNPGDLDWSPVERLGDVTLFDRTPADKIVERAADADIVLTNKVPFSADTLRQLPRLRFICVLATGYNIIDTAGMRKKKAVEDETLERYSVLRSIAAIDRCDVALLLIDAQTGVTEQDTKVAGLAHEAGKACIIVVNKWDLVEKDGKTMDKMREDIRRDLSYMTYAPILFISAATGQRVPRLFELINYVHSQACTRITTGLSLIHI